MEITVCQPQFLAAEEIQTGYARRWKCTQEVGAFKKQNWSQYRKVKMGGVWWSSFDSLNYCKSAGHEKGQFLEDIMEDLDMPKVCKIGTKTAAWWS